MPLVAHRPLPAFDRLRAGGYEVLDPDRAVHQDIRELHIGLLNMMPDAALRATELQFMRLLGASNQIVQIYVHLFTVPGLDRSPAAERYLDDHYEPFDALAEEGLDALVVTGANVTDPDLSKAPFWRPLAEVLDWADESVTSVLCSCLATHAVLRQRYGIRRVRMPQKRWGVFEHRVVDTGHPLVFDINTRFDAPHSRWNDVSAEQLDASGLPVLLASEQAGVHLATSPDGLRFVLFQGHPEYDRESLLKEYKREIGRFLSGELDALPPLPVGYVRPEGMSIVEAHRAAVRRARETGEDVAFPEDELLAFVDNTWTDTAKAIFNNWLGLVYRLTDLDRRRPFMPGVDPTRPLAGTGWTPPHAP